jgi:hypothetical protein
MSIHTNLTVVDNNTENINTSYWDEVIYMYIYIYKPTLM